MKKIKSLFIVGIVLVLTMSCLRIFAENREMSDLKIKGFHLDLRIQVMKPEALKAFANELAAFGINTLIMEWEGTFPFESHPLIPNRYAYTKDEIRDFVAYCKDLNIDVVPMQQSLGHLEYILRHNRYAGQREDSKDVSQICPMKTELNRVLFTELFAEMASLHPSKYFHIGGDEAYLFGHCDLCSQHIEEKGKAKLLSDHLKMLCEIIVSLGKIPVLWADVANEYPAELAQLPKETVFLVWNYGWAYDRFGDPNKIIEKGFEVWGAPALRSHPDNFYLTRWEYHFQNIRDFIPLCRKNGYKGIVMTSWSTSGIYSTVFEDEKTIADLIAVRNVYPISGFRVLMAAYAQALNQDESLDMDQFMMAYSNERFGFTKEQALRFWKAIKGKPYMIIDGKVEGAEDVSVEALWNSSKDDQKVLAELMPTKNKEELEHFRLMKAIRENYLAFRVVEEKVNEVDFTVEMVSGILTQLDAIIAKDAVISRRFRELNEHLLYPSEIEQENQVRIKRVHLLYERLLKRR